MSSARLKLLERYDLMLERTWKELEIEVRYTTNALMVSFVRLIVYECLSSMLHPMKDPDFPFPESSI